MPQYIVVSKVKVTKNWSLFNVERRPVVRNGSIVHINKILDFKGYPTSGNPVMYSTPPSPTLKVKVGVLWKGSPWTRLLYIRSLEFLNLGPLLSVWRITNIRGLFGSHHFSGRTPVSRILVPVTDDESRDHPTHRRHATQGTRDTNGETWWLVPWGVSLLTVERDKDTPRSKMTKIHKIIILEKCKN